MKVDLIGIDSDSQCFINTIKITNNVFSMNKQGLKKDFQLVPGDSF